MQRAASPSLNSKAGNQNEQNHGAEPAATDNTSALPLSAFKVSGSACLTRNVGQKFMAITINNAKGEFMTFGGHRWAMFLTMAEHYGWVPQGTKKPQGYGFFRKWPGNYDSSDGQVVVLSDAKNLAAAITGAISSLDFDDHRCAMEKQMKEEVLASVSPELAASFRLSFDKADFQAFGEFCSRGSFRID